MTLRRWACDWRKNHRDIWTLRREGEKYFSENINKTILRDLSLLSVGDVWIADGHVLNFEVINPWSGKPKRMMMIMFYDWASRMPVGASIAVTENSEHISAALRNAILRTGYTPRVVYLDNGKAFRSKLFHGNWKSHDLESEIGGLYQRLGIEVVFAKPYNAKAKNIERFFRTFQEDFERYVESFSGSSVADKPARMMRNEKWLQKFSRNEPISVLEAERLIDVYVHKLYGKTPHRGLSGKKPIEVLTEGGKNIPPARRIDSRRLNYLMLKREIKKINSNGIYLGGLKLWFWDEKLVSHVGQAAIIKYDFFNLDYILVYDDKNRFICKAKVRQLQHPMLKLDKKLNGEFLTKEIKQIKRIQKNARKLAEEEMKRIDEATANCRFLPEPDSDLRLFDDKPLLKPLPKKKKSLEELAMESHSTPLDPSSSVDPSTPLRMTEAPLRMTKKKKPKNTEFEELLKNIGVK